MAQNTIQTWREAPLSYSLSFKNSITAPAEELEELVLKQGVGVEVEEDENLYTLTLKWVKVNKKLYQPTEIEAELFFMQQLVDPTGAQSTKAPSFYAVTNLLLQRQVEVKVTNSEAKDNKDFTIATNCYVFEVRPQLKCDNNGTRMEVRLSIFSMDKLMTLNKYSKAYVTRKLGSDILRPESLNFGMKADGWSPIVETKVSTLSHLSYGDDASEFIQPYLVQYNESFYDFLKRTSNRCGEFLYFEDGMLILGLRNTGEPEILTDYASVTMREVATDPLVIRDYVRDSMKEGTSVGELNYTVVDKLDTGFPKDAFPVDLSANAELSSDEYFFPLVADKFTSQKREAFYDMPINKGIKSLTAVTMADQFIEGFAKVAVSEGILGVVSKLTTNGKNKAMKEAFAEAAEAMPEQAKDGKIVQYGTLNEEGWTTIDYYNDIHQHQHELERQMICIDMGTTFAQVKLGQKISIDALPDNYIIVEIQTASEKDKELRKMTIYAIPTLTEGKTETYFPPVLPVPIIRKSGPQTAFVTDNNDPKYQGRVRVAFPWQSMKEQLKKQLEKQQTDLKKKQDERKKLTGGMRRLKLKVWNALEELYELRDYCNADAAGRQTMLSAKDAEIQALREKISKLKADKAKLESKKQTSSSDTSASDVDAAVKQQSIEELDAEIKKKEEKLTSMREHLEVMKTCAEEHDKEKGKEGYKLEENNKVALKEIDKFNHLYYTEYEAPIKRAKELEKEEKELTKQQEAIKKVLDTDIKAVSTPWIRVASPMATPGGGAFFKPQIGDEVLINFDNDNVERPYVVGSLYSKNTLEPGESLDRAGSPSMNKQVSMSIMSPNGHHITFSDPTDGQKFVFGLNPGANFVRSVLPLPPNLIPNSKELAGGIHIGDRYGIYEIEMCTHDRAVNIKSPLGTVNIDAFTGITINAPNGDVNIKGKNVNIEAGNKVSIISGKNITPPDIGEPDYRCGTPIWQELKGWRGVGTFFANLGRGLRYGVAWFGHNVLTEVPKGITGETAAAAADLSLVRHMFEVLVKPVDGTLLIKSKRYLKLEAGSGTAKIKSDRFMETKAKKVDSVEKFYKELIEGLVDLNNKIAKFYEEYAKLWEAARTAKANYAAVAEAFLKKPNVDDIVKKAFCLTESIEGDTLNDEVKFENLKEGVIQFRGYTNHLSDDIFLQNDNEGKKKYVIDNSICFANAIINLHNYVLDFPKLMDTSDANIFMQAAMNAFKKIADEDLDKWKRKYGDSNPTSDFLEEQETLFTKDVTQTLVKRKTSALYMVKVANDEDVKKNKFLELGFDESDVVDSKLKKDYNWKNFMTHFDHATSHGSMGRIYALEWFWEPIKKRFKNPFGVIKENDVWGDKGGQILFSDNDGATLHFDGEGLKSESQSNLGNRDQLLKLLLSIK